MYDLALYAHFFGMAFALYFIVRADHDGFLWMHGTKKTLAQSTIDFYHRGVWAALAILFGSGVILTVPIYMFILESQMFQAKMLFVLALTANGYMIGAVDRIATTRSFASLSVRERFPLLLSGGISLTCWIGAFVAGVLLFPGWALF